MTGAKSGDHAVLTAPNGWPTYEKVTLVAHVSADTVTYDICNLTGSMQNFGTGPPVRALIFR